MKINLKFNLFKKNSTFKKKNYDIDADFYWKIILYVTFFLILLGALFGFYIYFQINKDQVLTQNDSSLKAGTVDKSRIDKVLKYFSERANTSRDIINSPSPIVDPSQ
jgi:hypothetical protein